jgi:integrase/recombinase XerD
MTTLLEPPNEIATGESVWSPDEAQLAAAAFLARYRGRTLEAYQYDLRSFFQWAEDHHLEVLAASRAHLEWYRTAMEQRGLAAATIDRRLCTVCGYYRFAHLDCERSSDCDIGDHRKPSWGRCLTGEGRG